MFIYYRDVYIYIYIERERERHIDIDIYIYYISLSLSISLSLYIYIYIYIYMFDSYQNVFSSHLHPVSSLLRFVDSKLPRNSLGHEN